MEKEFEFEQFFVWTILYIVFKMFLKTIRWNSLYSLKVLKYSETVKQLLRIWEISNSKFKQFPVPILSRFNNYFLLYIFLIYRESVASYFMHKDISTTRAKWLDTVDLEKTWSMRWTRGRKQLYSLKFMHDVHRVFIARFIPPFLPFPPPLSLSFLPFFFLSKCRRKKYPTKRRGTSLFSLFFSFLFFFFHLVSYIPEQRFPNGGKLPLNKKVGQKLNYRTFWTPDLLFFPDNISRPMIGQRRLGIQRRLYFSPPYQRSTGSRNSW